MTCRAAVRSWAIPAGAASVRSPRTDRGAVAVEVVLLVPALMLVVALFVYGFRLWSARSAVLSAAEAGARAATTATGAASGRLAAIRAVDANLASLGASCSSHRSTVDAIALSQPPGTSGRVTVTVTCVVPMSDLLLPGAPGHVTVTRSASEVVDTFTERRP